MAAICKAHFGRHLPDDLPTIVTKDDWVQTYVNMVASTPRRHWLIDTILCKDAQSKWKGRHPLAGLFPLVRHRASLPAHAVEPAFCSTSPSTVAKDSALFSFYRTYGSLAGDSYFKEQLECKTQEAAGRLSSEDNAMPLRELFDM